jgi:replication-associated recombination protein RarA
MTPLVEKYRPRRLEDFVGLPKQRAILGKLAADPWDSAWLLVGDSGTGKTTMALAVAEIMGAELHHIASRQCDLESVGKVCDACFYVPWAGGFHVVLVDEADQMTTAAQHAWLSKLDSTECPPKTVFIFTANQTGKLEDRFVSRCRVLEFSAAGAEKDVVALLDRIWLSEGMAGHRKPYMAGLVKTASGNVRSAIMALELEILTAEVKAPVTVAAPAVAAASSAWRDTGGGRMVYVGA